MKMIYDLKNIFEGFQSRMKNKLKDLSDENKTREKILQNTFIGADITGIDKTCEPYEVCHILGRNIDGDVDYFHNLRQNKKGGAIISFAVASDYDISDFSYIDVNANIFWKNKYENKEHLTLKTRLIEKEIKDGYSYFYVDPEFYMEYDLISYTSYNYTLVTDISNKSVEDYDATSRFINLYNFIISDEFIKTLKVDFNEILSSLREKEIVDMFHETLIGLYCFFHILRKEGFKIGISKNDYYFNRKRKSFNRMENYVESYFDDNI